MSSVICVSMRVCNVTAENVSSLYLSVGVAPNKTQLRRDVLRLTANVGVGLTCTVVGGMPPPSLSVLLNGVNITDQVCSTVSSLHLHFTAAVTDDHFTHRADADCRFGHL